MPTEIERNFGYDDMGNHPGLLAEADRVKIDNGDWQRAAGDTICHKCRIRFGAHPTVQGALWLRRLCTGKLVKL